MFNLPEFLEGKLAVNGFGDLVAYEKIDPFSKIPLECRILSCGRLVNLDHNGNYYGDPRNKFSLVRMAEKNNIIYFNNQHTRRNRNEKK